MGQHNYRVSSHRQPAALPDCEFFICFISKSRVFLQKLNIWTVARSRWNQRLARSFSLQCWSQHLLSHNSWPFRMLGLPRFPHWGWYLFAISRIVAGLPRWHHGEESTCQDKRCNRHGFYLWVGKIPWRRKWQPTPGFLPGESHGQRSLKGYSPWGRKESHSTDWLSTAETPAKKHGCWGAGELRVKYCYRICLGWQLFFWSLRNNLDGLLGHKGHK